MNKIKLIFHLIDFNKTKKNRLKKKIKYKIYKFFSS